MEQTILSQNWRELNLFARSYLDLQPVRVGYMARLRKMKEHELLDRGLLEEVSRAHIDEATGKKRGIGKIYRPIDKSKDTKRMIKEIEAEMESHTAYQILLSHTKMLLKQEKKMLFDSVELFKDSTMWEWCMRTKGLGPVAGMTFAGFINPDKAKDPADLWSYAGLTPFSRLRRGVQSRSNPLMKGRVWMIATNVIRSVDPYYYNVYKIKKNYYINRPDLIALKEGVATLTYNSETGLDEYRMLDLSKEELKPKKGWQGWMDNKAKRVIMKLLLSHALELISNGASKGKYSHRNPIPIKPEDPTERDPILKNYAHNHDLILERANRIFERDNTPNKKSYFEFITHVDMSSIGLPQNTDPI